MPEPLATTLNAAVPVPPEAITVVVALPGCVVIAGASPTVSVATFDVLLPKVLVTVQRYRYPLHPVTDDSDSVAEFVPIFAQVEPLFVDRSH